MNPCPTLNMQAPPPGKHKAILKQPYSVKRSYVYYILIAVPREQKTEKKNIDIRKSV